MFQLLRRYWWVFGLRGALAVLYGLLINNGASLSRVQVALRQNDPRMAARYAHLFPENRDVADRIDNEGTAGILLRAREAAGNSTTRILPDGQKDKNKRGCLAATP
jgi:hypothetical protein